MCNPLDFLFNVTKKIKIIKIASKPVILASFVHCTVCKQPRHPIFVIGHEYITIFYIRMFYVGATRRYAACIRCLNKFEWISNKCYNCRALKKGKTCEHCRFFRRTRRELEYKDEDEYEELDGAFPPINLRY